MFTLRWFGFFIVALIAIALAPNTYYLYLLGMIAITTLVGVGLNILVGLSGQVSIGHAGFFAIGAYTGSLLMTKLHWNFWLAMVIATIAATGTGLALAAPAFRVKGPQLAMVTIAFGIIVERILVEWVSLTGGFGGIFNIPEPTVLGLQPALREVVLLAWVGTILAVLSLMSLKKSAWGRAFQAVRDDEIAATATGLDILKVRLMAFAVSAAFTGVAGVFFAAIVGFISPDSFTFHRSILFLLVVILGGLGTVAGAVIGAIMLVILPEMLNNFAEYQLLVFGILLLLTLWFTPEGIVSFFLHRFQRQAPVFPPSLASEELPSLIVNYQNRSRLEIKKATMHFGGVKALDEVDLIAEAATVTSIIGPNGAGKTTLLNLLTGFYPIQTGSIHLGNVSLTHRSTINRVRNGLSRTFQTPRLFDSLSVLDNLRVAHTGEHLGSIFAALTNWKQRHKIADKALIELLSFMGYRGDICARADQLSFGDRRLVEIARALAMSPQVLLLDEPVAGLGQQQRDWIATLLRRLAEAGMTVIPIEHDMTFVMTLSDRIVVLDHGKVICTGTPNTVQRDPKVLTAYLGITHSSITRTHSGSATPLLVVDSLVAGYGELQILHNISLDVKQGEFVAVVGANGAGKTTLLKSIMQLLRPQSGTVLFQAENLIQRLPQQLARQGIVLIPEGRQVFTHLTVIDNLRLGGFHRRDRRIEMDIEAMFNHFPRLRDLQHQPAGLLSGGEQQMLAIARGMMARPKLLLLDEPSLGLASQWVVSLYQMLASLCDEGLSILLVDQVAQSTFAVADRLYLLDGGRIITTGTPAQFQNDPAIVQSYLGRRQL
jgi:ABC-type branched-subunit amino acid transport system ATPase component/ABC-type branched-subunit amino acid transport system permease subunit